MSDLMTRIYTEARRVNEDLRGTSPWVFFALAVLAFLFAALVSFDALRIDI